MLLLAILVPTASDTEWTEVNRHVDNSNHWASKLGRTYIAQFNTKLWRFMQIKQQQQELIVELKPLQRHYLLNAG